MDTKAFSTVNIQAPESLLKIFITRDVQGPVKVVVTVENEKADSELAVMAEAISRIITLCLRTPSAVRPEIRMQEIAHQLEKIGGSKTVGFGPNQVLSMPDAIAKVLIQDALNHSVRPTFKAASR